MAATSSNTIHPAFSAPGSISISESLPPPLSLTQIVRGEAEAVPANTRSTPSLFDSAVHREPIAPSRVRAFPKDSSTPDFVPENPSDNSEGADGGCNNGKRPAWNMPLNGSAEVGPIMGAESWPDLVVSARAYAKPGSDSLKAPVDEPVVSISQGTVVASSSTSSQKQHTDNSNPNFSPKNSSPAGHGCFKPGAGGSTDNHGPSEELATVTGVEAHREFSSPRDRTQRGAPREPAQRGSQSNTGYDHSQRGSFRRNNGGPHPRADDSSHHSYGGRHDHDRGNHFWAGNRNYIGRDAVMQPQRGFPRAFARPPPPLSAPFVTLPMPRPFSNPMGFELASPMLYMPPPPPPFFVPFLPPAMFPPAMDPQLRSNIVTQIEYYFSNDNLVKDLFLRKNMDNQGWVRIELISGFKKVRDLTMNIQHILEALQTSSILEVQNNKVRRRNDWVRWIIPSHLTGFTGSSSGQDMLASRVRGMSLQVAHGEEAAQGTRF